MSDKDGGPAFPSDLDEGMSLRDYFAGQVVATILNGTSKPLEMLSHVAKTAYQMADAMLAERAK